MASIRNQHVRAVAVAVLMALATAWPAADARPHRSHAVRAEFMRQHPCPANGATRGNCPGWEIDHRQPLKCGGPDSTENMQWLTVQEHKAKTAREAKSCRTKRAQANQPE